MFRARLTVCTVLPLVAASMSCAATIVGTWYGKFDFSAAKPPNPTVAQQFSAMAAKSKKVEMKLVIRGDKTFTLTTTGLSPKPETSNGTWKQVGTKITLVGAGETKNLKVNSDGKTLYWALTDGFGAKVTFGHNEPHVH